MTGADGQPVLQVVPLQLPGQIDASGLGQIDLSQLDPSTLQVRERLSVRVRAHALGGEEGGGSLDARAGLPWLLVTVVVEGSA